MCFSSENKIGSVQVSVFTQILRKENHMLILFCIFLIHFILIDFFPESMRVGTQAKHCKGYG